MDLMLQLRQRGIIAGENWLTQCLEYIKQHQHLPYLRTGQLSDSIVALPSSSSSSSSAVLDSMYRYYLETDLHHIHSTSSPDLFYTSNSNTSNTLRRLSDNESGNDGNTALSPFKSYLLNSLTTDRINNTPIRLSSSSLPSSLPIQYGSYLFIQDTMILQCDEIINIGTSSMQQQHQQQQCEEQEMTNDGPKALNQRLFKLFLTDGVINIVGIETTPIPGMTLSMKAGTKLLIQGVVVRRGAMLLHPGCCKVLGGEVEELQALNTMKLAAKSNSSEQSTSAVPAIDGQASTTSVPSSAITTTANATTSAYRDVSRANSSSAASSASAGIASMPKDIIENKVIDLESMEYQPTGTHARNRTAANNVVVVDSADSVNDVTVIDASPYAARSRIVTHINPSTSTNTTVSTMPIATSITGPSIGGKQSASIESDESHSSNFMYDTPIDISQITAETISNFMYDTPIDISQITAETIISSAPTPTRAPATHNSVVEAPSRQVPNSTQVPTPTPIPALNPAPVPATQRNSYGMQQAYISAEDSRTNAAINTRQPGLSHATFQQSGGLNRDKSSIARANSTLPGTAIIPQMAETDVVLSQEDSLIPAPPMSVNAGVKAVSYPPTTAGQQSVPATNLQINSAISIPVLERQDTSAKVVQPAKLPEILSFSFLLTNPQSSGIVRIVPAGIKQLKVSKSGEFVVSLLATDTIDTTQQHQISVASVLTESFLGITASEYSAMKATSPAAEFKVYQTQLATKFASFSGLFLATTKDGAVWVQARKS